MGKGNEFLVTPQSLWSEVRERLVKSCYVDLYGAILDNPVSQLSNRGDWLVRRDISEVEQEQAMQEQLRRATISGLSDALHIPLIPREHSRVGASVYSGDSHNDGFSTWVESGDYKLWLQGSRVTGLENNDTLTRIYVSLDSMYATDAYFFLVQAMMENGVISDISMCLYTGDATNHIGCHKNAIVIYLNQTQIPSRLGLVDAVVHAYQAAKKAHPEFFILTEVQKRANWISVIESLKIPISEEGQLSLVEMPSVESYDGAGMGAIFRELGISVPGYNRDLLAALRANQGIGMQEPRSRISMFKPSLSDGQTLTFIRNLSMPPLISRSIKIVRKKSDGSYSLEDPIT